MVRLMKVETNASTMFVAYEADEQRVWIMDNEYTNEEDADIREVEDWTSWTRFNDVEDVEAWLEIDANNPDAPVIVDEIEF